MEVRGFSVGPLATNTYLVRVGEVALAIDPGQGAAEVLTEAAEQLGVTIETVLNTHGHWDHVADNAALLRKVEAGLLIHGDDAEMITTETPLTFGMDLPWEPSTPTGLLEDGAEVRVGEERFVVLHTPGHTPGGVCLWWEEGEVLIAGDTLFAGTYGRVDLPGSDPARMVESLRRLTELPDATRVYPGHGPETTIGAERDWMERL
ncbi:MAG: MBL fold metallo-hydrolase [Chloroflexota bacterium]|nr:MBL fold metallo-hydrolase [Chloroflexota bacterium]MDP6756875.1 MBL fold metallo-hydrolase [Chloroflexota bacterium]